MKVSAVTLRSLIYGLRAGKLWSKESQGGWWAQHGPCSWVSVAACAFLRDASPIRIFGACCSPSEGRQGVIFSSFDQAAGYLHGILDSFSDACDDQYQVAVCELVPEQMQSKRVPRKHPQSRTAIFLQPLALKFPLLSGLCKSRPRRCRLYLAIFLPSPPSGCCFLSRARGSALGSLSGQAAAARCSPALPVPKDTAALKQAHKSYVHGDASSWASQVEHPELIDILDWIFLCLCSLSIKW